MLGSERWTPYIFTLGAGRNGARKHTNGHGPNSSRQQKCHGKGWEAGIEKKLADADRQKLQPNQEIYKEKKMR